MKATDPLGLAQVSCDDKNGNPNVYLSNTDKIISTATGQTIVDYSQPSKETVDTPYGTLTPNPGIDVFQNAASDWAAAQAGLTKQQQLSAALSGFAMVATFAFPLAGSAAGDLAAVGSEARATTDFLSDVTVVSKGKVVGQGTVDLRGVIKDVLSGDAPVRDIFQNRQGLLPAEPAGYYKEFTVPTPGVSGAGSQRIIQGAGGELYYTPDHYGSFIPLN